jgi:hypothetical protein
MTEIAVLPSGFERLAPLVDYWAGEDTQTRWDRRARSSMAEIKSFYDAMLPHADQALLHLQSFDLTTMPEPEARLYRLVLSLAHAAMAVELHGQPRAPFSPFPHSIKLVKGPSPFN